MLDDFKQICCGASRNCRKQNYLIIFISK